MCACVCVCVCVLFPFFSTDVKAVSGEYGWTHWDNCIGEPAGFIPSKASQVASKGAATLSQKHGVTVESGVHVILCICNVILCTCIL